MTLGNETDHYPIGKVESAETGLDRMRPRSKPHANRKENECNGG